MSMDRDTSDPQAGRGDRESLSERVYRTLRLRLRQRAYAPGQFLSESMLATELGVSRTPVREAVQRLAQEGVVTVIPKRGIMVAALTLDAVEEVYALREVLEGLAARLCAVRAASAGIVERLEAILARTAEAPDDIDVLTALDHEFHAEIANGAANGRLASLLENMRDADLLQQYGLRDAPHRARYRVASLNEHRAVVDAIDAREADEAEAAMREHCRSAARFVAEHLVGRR